MMGHLLGRFTSLPVCLATNELRVLPGHIYLIPPGKEMIVADGKLLIADRTRENGLSLPIDQFFRSLAQECRGKAIGVILSGTGSDGSRGICEIHAAGGYVLVQDAQTAKFDGMPNAAVNTGVVDGIYPPEQIVEQIHQLTTRPQQLPVANSDEPAAQNGVDPSYIAIIRLLRNKFGIDFSHYKSGTISRRIERRLMLNQVYDLAAYADRLNTDEDELDKLYRDLLIGVTRFFRDPEGFDLIHRSVIQELVQNATPQQELRFWIAGTGTGEEAYSLAMLISEELERHPSFVPVRIFATDVHNRSLEVAARGVYTEDNLRDITSERVAKYFVKRRDGYQVSPHLRKMIVFAPHNVIRDAPFTAMDFVSCRNLLIYLRPEAQKKALSLFHFALKVNGVMWLGPSETLGDLGPEFDVQDEHWHIYRKRRDVRLSASDRGAVKVGVGQYGNRALPQTNRGGVAHQLEMYDRLLEEFMPPSILVTDSRDLLHVFSGASKYLTHKDGRPSTDVVELVHPDLKMALLTAMQRCVKEQSPVVHAGLKCSSMPDEDLKLVIKPFFNRTANRHEFLIVFDAQQCDFEERSYSIIELEEGISPEQVEVLEAELQYAKESLQATIAELESTNQELQSSNEELLASNEELQSTNEELNSVNEELYTVNMEHQRKIAELTELTDDMENLLNSTEVDTVFLDREFRIRKFTPGIAKTFNLIPQDIGRRIDSFTHNVKNLALLDTLEQVLQSEEPLELEVGGADEDWYLLRILPYFSRKTVEGLVMTLINITSLKSAETRLTELSEIVQQSSDAIIRFDLDGTIRTWNRGASEMLGYAEKEAIGRPFSMLMPDSCEVAMQSLLREVAEGKPVSDHRTVWLSHGQQALDMSLHITPIRDSKKMVSGASAIARDISELKKAESKIREAVRRRDQFLAMLSHELRNPFAAILNANSLLKEEGVDQSTSDEAREVVEHQLQHISRLLDDLLDVARIANDKLVLHTEVIDISKIVMDVVDCVGHQLETCKQQLDLEPPDVPLFVDGDIGRLQQAQVNLLVNASKYSPKGSTIRYSVTREGGEVVIRVGDSGDGIPVEIADQIFEPFVQAEQTIDRSQGGMGLGLSLVRMIAEAHNGGVEVTSFGKGMGSVFTIRLPLTAAPPSNAAKVGFTILKGTRLLLIEDSDSIRRMLARSLELKGFTVDTANNGVDGLERFHAFEPQVAIVDIGLPDIDGYELAQRVRANISKKVLLVAVTGYGQDQDRRKALSAGFDMHLVKPIDPLELAGAIAPFLGPGDAGHR
ncbi:Autoinducer 2 sensor kinase/phosphatase LuxQ [Blastopirellula retiformator]|uniref:histidine kinase n=2 Tax=Blastopirellula retiformator TaxID=2527970 RepID=A0A5C5V7X0_9BACT|nr:Autoinducer 2 sensor kinase/phosphatase LuxQ [Blastopirellula retiformator]